MELLKLKERQDLTVSEDFKAAHSNYQKLIEEIEKHKPSVTIIDEINKSTHSINLLGNDLKPLIKQYTVSQNEIVKLVERELKLVPIDYYRKLWLVLGMTVFGLPFGVVFAMALDNMAFIGIGLPIGLPIGIAIGSGMDAKAKEEGRQLEVELK